MTAEPMTQPENQHDDLTPVTLKVDPSSDSELAALLTEFHAAKKAQESAAERVAELDSRLRAELSRMTLDGKQPNRYQIAADSHGAYPSYNYYFTPPGYTLDSKSLKEDDPVTWVKFAKKRNGFWTLRASDDSPRRGKRAVRRP